jgi:hypothetical protein
MAVTYDNADLWALENCKYALDLANGFGLDDTAVGAITSTGTVTKLLAAIAALPLLAKYQGNAQSLRDITDTITEAAKPFVPLPAVGTVTPTLHNSSGTGTLPNSTTYYYRVTAVDSAGLESLPSPQASQATGSTGTADAHDVALAWTAIAGASSYRVYISTTSGVFTGGYVAAASNSYTHNSPTLTSLLTVKNLPIAGDALGKKGFITDAMVETARAAGTFASLLNAVADQHPTGTAFRLNKSDLQRHP